MALLQSWRWFGPNDPISLQQIRNTGAKGIVTALHHIPYGELWSIDEILHRKKLIETNGFVWSVVESVPVHEDIKKRSGNFRQFIDNYKQTLVNLSQCNITTVCYNFMPAFDWLRTNLKKSLPDGSFVSEFHIIAICAFDIFILKRKNAEYDYTSDIVAEAERYFHNLSAVEVDNLMKTLLLSLPGNDKPLTIDFIRNSIDEYRNIDASQFKENLLLFVKEIAQVADEVGIRLAIHPDDPPLSVFGLPRVVSSISDLKDIIACYPSINNGFTLCTGSLGAGYFNDCSLIARELSSHIQFAHPRNVVRDAKGNFSEVSLFDGDVDIPSIMEILVDEEEKRKKEGRPDYQIPIRADHGNLMLDDVGRTYYPGYSLYGRLKNLAELRGLEKGIRKVKYN